MSKESHPIREIAISANALKKQQKEERIKKIRDDLEYLRPNANLFSRQLRELLSNANSSLYGHLLKEAASGSTEIRISEGTYDCLIDTQVRSDNSLKEPSAVFDKFLSFFYYPVPKHNYVYLREFSSKHKAEILSEELKKIFDKSSSYYVDAWFEDADDDDSNSDEYAGITISF